jgi:hypothetical protein
MGWFVSVAVAGRDLLGCAVGDEWNYTIGPSRHPTKSRNEKPVAKQVLFEVFIG